MILATFYKGMEKVGNPKIPLEAPKADSWKNGISHFLKTFIFVMVFNDFRVELEGTLLSPSYVFVGLHRNHFQPTVLAGIIDFSNVL